MQIPGWHAKQGTLIWQSKNSNCAGFAMPMAFALGLCMIAIATTSIMLAQEGRNAAAFRRDNAASVLISDSAIAEILTALSSRRNSRLLGKNYDPLNPQTGVSYLGEDGIPNNGDEKKEKIDEWNQKSSYACLEPLGMSNPDIALTQQINSSSSYQLLAYRYHSGSETGHLLVKGTHRGISHYAYITIDVTQDLSLFPGVLVSESLYWQGREITGDNSMLYFSPNLSADQFLDSTASTRDDARDSYLDAIWSGAEDGFTEDLIEQPLVACELTYSLSNSPQGTVLDTISSSLVLSGEMDRISSYQTDGIDLSGNSEILVDTTQGPVHIYINGILSLREQAKIRNIRLDGKPPQAGDLRLIQTQDNAAPVVLYDTSCIEKAFIYAPNEDIHLLTTGDGCPGNNNSNILGVVWAEDIENSTNSLSSRSYDRGEHSPDIPGSGLRSGIEVPTDLSSLQDAMESINLPILYQIRGVRSWEKVGI